MDVKSEASCHDESIISCPASLLPFKESSISSSAKESMKINVIFRKVEEWYEVGSDIQVCYTILGGFDVEARDWIGLYKVGWRSKHDYVFYDWSPYHDDYSKDDEIQNRVIFAGSKMPKEDGDFYQFCYVSSNGLVRGASTPFQFKVVNEEDDFVVEEEKGEVGGDSDGGLMIVKTRKDQLKDKVKKVKVENLAMTEKLLSLEAQIELSHTREAELKESLEKLKESQHAFSSLNEERNEELTETKQQIVYLQGCLKGVQERMDVLNQEKTCMERRLDDSDGYISSLQDKIKNLVIEKDLLQGRIHSQADENLAIKNYSRHLMIDCEEKVRKMKMSEKETSIQMTKCLEELKKIKTSMAYLSDKLQNSEDKMGVAEHCKKMLNEEVVALKEKLEVVEIERGEENKKLTMELDKKVKEIAAKDMIIQEKDRQSEAINAQLREYDMKLGGRLVDEVKAQLESLNSKLVEKEKEVLEKDERLMEGMKEVKKEKEKNVKEMNELEGSLYALQTAHKVLLQRLSTQNNKQGVDDTIKDNIKDDEISMLKHRLNVSAEMYKQKCLENFSKSSDIEKDRTRGNISSFDLVHSNVITHESQLKRKLAEQEKEILELQKKIKNCQFNQQVESGDDVVCEEERFVDVLNDYSVVTFNHQTIPNSPSYPHDSTEATSVRSCPLCPLVFEDEVTEFDMTTHVESHILEEQYCCPICQVSIPSEQQLIRHTESHFE